MIITNSFCIISIHDAHGYGMTFNWNYTLKYLVRDYQYNKRYTDGIIYLSWKDIIKMMKHIIYNNVLILNYINEMQKPDKHRKFSLGHVWFLECSDLSASARISHKKCFVFNKIIFNNTIHDRPNIKQKGIDISYGTKSNDLIVFRRKIMC